MPHFLLPHREFLLLSQFNLSNFPHQFIHFLKLSPNLLQRLSCRIKFIYFHKNIFIHSLIIFHSILSFDWFIFSLYEFRRFFYFLFHLLSLSLILILFFTFFYFFIRLF